MKQKWIFLCCGLFLGWYGFEVYDFSILYENVQKLNYLAYNDLISVVFPTLLLAFMFIMIGASQIERVPKTIQKPGYFWMSGFLGVLVLLLVAILYVNPHAVFPWNNVDGYLNTTAYIPTAARAQKLNLLSEQPKPPALVVLGSSRAFTIPSAYVRSQTKLSTYNMAVNGGLPIDFLLFGKHIVNTQPELPSVLMIELRMPYSRDDVSALLPLTLLPYQEPGLQWDNLRGMMIDLFSIQSVSDMFYQILYAPVSSRTPAMSFKNDGTGVRTSISTRQYQAGLDRLSETYAIAQYCLTAQDQTYIEQLIELALENQIALVFYRSPLNQDYLDRADANHIKLSECEEQFNIVMTEFQKTYPNVFFVDLTYYKPVSSLREKGYTDVHHLKPSAARLLVNVLTPELIKANLWSVEHRTGTTGTEE